MIYAPGICFRLEALNGNILRIVRQQRPQHRGDIVSSLRRRNPSKRFFWTGDSLQSGRSWFARIERELRWCKGVISLITNNQSGTNNWINLEIGAAIGGEKFGIIIIAPGISVPLELSRPLQELQYVIWADRAALGRALKRSKLNGSKAAVEELVSALEPPKIVSCRYGEGTKWHEFGDVERKQFEELLENRKELVIGNHLANCDPSPGKRKALVIQVKRAGQSYARTVEEGAVLYRSYLW